MRSPRDLALLLLGRLRPTPWQETLVLAGVIGALAALATIGFRSGLALAERTLYGRDDGLVRIAAALPAWARLLVPAAGGLLAGWLLAWSRRAPRAGAGSDYMEAIGLGDGDLPVRVSLLRALSSAATVTSGGAIGREGPMVQLAALAGSLTGRWKRAPVPRRRLMVACGAAAGIATAYNAPIAGALFVAEIVLRSLAIEAVGALLVASVAAHVVEVGLVDSGPVYRMPAFVLPGGELTLLLPLVGAVCGLAAPAYLWLLDHARSAFGRLRLPPWACLALGGLLVGAVSLLRPDVWGNGYSVVNSILGGGWTVPALLAVLALKLLAVGASTGSGAVGGIFTPTLFVGAVAGALCAAAAAALGHGDTPAAASVAVGMGAFLSACTHAPLTSVLMIFEMTGNYGIVVPSMLSCVLAFSIARAIRARSIYSSATGSPLPTPSLAIAADFLRGESATIPEGASLRELEGVFLRFRWPHVYVVDPQGRFAGAIPLHDAAALLRPGEAAVATWPAAIVRTDYPRVSPSTPFWQVLETFAKHPGERLPVVDEQGRLAGHVTKTDLVLTLREQLPGT